MKNTKKQIFAAALLIVISAISSCKKEANLGGDIAFVAVYNAIPSATALNFLIDNRVVNGSTPLIFGANTAYTGVYQGTYTAQTVIANSSTALAPTQVSFEGKISRSLFLTGTTTAVNYFWIMDDLGVVDTERAKVRFLNMSPDAGALVLELQLLGTKTTFTDRSNQQYTDYISFTPGTEYTINLLDRATNTSVATTIRATFAKGKLYTIWAKGLTGSTVDAEKLSIQLSVQN